MKRNSLKIATFNICGWKSACRKGLLKWIEEERIDILAVQEIRTERIVKPLNSLFERLYFLLQPKQLKHI